MKKMIVLIILISSLLAGCTGSNVERTEKRNGENIVVLKDDTVKVPESDQKYKNELTTIEKVTMGDIGFFTAYGDILISRTESLGAMDFVIYNPKDKSEQKLNNVKGCKYYSISPDGKKMLLVNDSSLSTFDIPSGTGIKAPDIKSFYPNDSLLVKKLKYIDKENTFLDYSTGWGSIDSIVYSDRYGAVYVLENGTDKPRTFDIDSTYKTNIKIVDNKAVYIKKDYLRMEDLGLKNKDYPKGNYLSYSSRDNMADVILEPSESLNIVDYQLSPDGNNIALYLESSENNGALFIANVQDTLFTRNILYRNLIHISSSKISDFKWSNDSRKLAYSTVEGNPGLYVVNNDGKDNNRIVENQKISCLNWNYEGNSILFTQDTDNQKSIFQVNLKAKETN